MSLAGTPTAIWDLMGKDTVLLHHALDADEDSIASQHVRQSSMWFDSVWSTVAQNAAEQP